MSAITFATAAAAKKALENVIDDAYRLAKGELAKRIKRWQAQGKIDRLYKKIKNVRNVKTIWQVEKEVDLAKFYYPSKVTIDGQPKLINDLGDLGYEGNTVIEGTIGSGKSIFFRYLTARELAKGNAIPVFFELRRHQQDRGLTSDLVEELRSLGIETDEETFLFLADHGKVILFLDGFDEVKEQKRARLISDIENLARRYDRLRMLVSSRPKSGIENSPFFRVVKLAPLGRDEYKDVIPRMAHDTKIASAIIAAVEAAKGKVKGLLTTPLMVALLLIRFKVDQSIPENMIAFYDHIFILLLQRHDKLKAGYIRPRKSGLGDAKLEEIFSAICFLTRKSQQDLLGTRELKAHTKHAIQMASADCDTDKVLEDIVKITCLILEEGAECRFIHRSVQEYHAACFIKEQPECSARRFYEGMVRGFMGWRQELAFLEKTDEYRFLKFLVIPETARLLAVKADDPPKAWKTSPDFARETLANARFQVGFRRESQTSPITMGTSVRTDWAFAEYINHPLFGVVCGTLKERLSAAVHGAEGTTGSFPTFLDDGYRSARVADIMHSGCCLAELTAAVKTGLSKAHKRLISACQIVSHTEAKRVLFAFR